MGCDIHLYVEKKDENNKWVSGDEWEGDEAGCFDVPYEKRFYNNRNYYLFAILADVRNSHDLNTIINPRGLPTDVTEEVMKAFHGWGSDGHSHSYLTLKEILDFDWLQIGTISGVVNGYEYFRWNEWKRKEGESPDSYCAGVSGLNVIHIDEVTMQEKIKHIQEKSEKDGMDWCAVREEIKKALVHTYCEVQWDIAFHKMCRRFWSDTIPRLIAIGNPEDIRIVFWFDN